MENNIFDLEKNMMEYDDFMQNAPETAIRICRDHMNDNCPAGGGRNEEIGWYVIGTSGQGPYLLWKEK